MVADVALVVGVDHVEGQRFGGEGGGERGPVGGAVDGEGGRAEVGGVVGGPGEGEGALLGDGRAGGRVRGEEAGDDGGLHVAVLGAEDVEDYVFAAADVDGLGVVEDGVPGAVGGLELARAGGGAGSFYVDVLNVGAEVGEAPGDVVVVADDDEGSSGKCYSGDVEGGSGGSWGFEGGLVPDAGDAVVEVHVVREERLAGGGVGAGDGPVVGAGSAGVAGGVEGLLEGD